MRGISFETPLPVARVSPARMDIALFAGLLRERPRSSLPDDLERRLRESGLLVAARAPDGPLLRNTPVPLDAAADLERLFVRERPLRSDGEGVLDANLAAAVDAFFAEGGRRCYLLSLGDPPPYRASRGARLEALHRLLFGPVAPDFWASLETPDLDALFLPDLQGPRTFREQIWGIAHLFGLEEATYLCLPDLPELLSPPPGPIEPPDAPPERPPERFVPCSVPPAPPDPDQIGARLAPPRLDPAGFALWRRIMTRLLRLLHDHAPDRILLSSLPLPDDGLAARLAREELGAALAGIDADHLRLWQLVQPWLLTPEARGLPGALLPPEAALAGLLAGHALEQGAFLSAGGRPLRFDTRFAPALPDSEARVSLFEPTVRGPRLAIDHTTSADPAWRPAAVRRLMALLLRSARRFGEAGVFEPSGERLWREVEGQLRSLLGQAYAAGALRGRSPAEAFAVRCDRTTMTPADIDNGRLIAEVGFLPAVPVEEIRIRLPLAGGEA